MPQAGEARHADLLSPSGAPLNLLSDSTGVKFRGDCEWLSRKHGVTRKRQWRKVHIAPDTDTGDIRAVEFTSSRPGDSPILPEFLDQIPPCETMATVTADGAYDTRRCHATILERKAALIIPIRRNGRAWKPDCPAAISRNEPLRATRRLGKALWKRWSGSDTRSRVEAQMNRLKSFGVRIMPSDPDRQTAKIHIRIIRNCRSDQWRDMAHS
ncbi:IS5 family transposase [Rhodovulum sulfidophilum]|nr:IS5 family transposase [Rhodovulum sulfidophilum]